MARAADSTWPAGNQRKKLFYGLKVAFEFLQDSINYA
jgi:hypothetical protein